MQLHLKRSAMALALFLTGYLTFNTSLFAQALEKPKVSIAVGNKNLFYHLPLTLANLLGYFKDEGLQVHISDFADSVKALHAMADGSADIVSGAYEHTINIQAKGQPVVAFVLQSHAPQIVLATNNKTMRNYHDIADLKGKKIGVTALGSSTNIMTNFVLAKAGLKPTDVSFVAVGSAGGATSAIRSGRIDAIANVDPVITTLEKKNEIRIITDIRTLKDTEDVFGGPMPAAALYAPEDFIRKYPNTTQALTNAMVRTLKWIHKADLATINETIPDSQVMGNRALYIDILLKMREAISPDGIFPDAGPVTALKTLQTCVPELADKKIDLSRTYTNDFARKANDKYK